MSRRRSRPAHPIWVSVSGARTVPAAPSSEPRSVDGSTPHRLRLSTTRTPTPNGITKPRSTYPGQQALDTAVDRLPLPRESDGGEAAACLQAQKRPTSGAPTNARPRKRHSPSSPPFAGSRLALAVTALGLTAATTTTKGLARSLRPPSDCGEGRPDPRVAVGSQPIRGPVPCLAGWLSNTPLRKVVRKLVVRITPHVAGGQQVPAIGIAACVTSELSRAGLSCVVEGESVPDPLTRNRRGRPVVASSTSAAVRCPASDDELPGQRDCRHQLSVPDGPLNGPIQIGGDPAAVEVAVLGVRALVVEPRRVDTPRVERDVVSQRLIARRWVGVGPADRLGATADHGVQVPRLALVLTPRRARRARDQELLVGRPRAGRRSSADGWFPARVAPRWTPPSTRPASSIRTRRPQATTAGGRG